MDRSTFVYMDPKTPHDFSQCVNCWKFTGKSCMEFSPSDIVKETGSCNLYSTGKPNPENVGKETGGTTPEIAGYVDRKVRCEHCEFFEEDDSECLLFRTLNIDSKVNLDGCCNAQTAEDEDEQEEKDEEVKKQTLKKFIRK